MTGRRRLRSLDARLAAAQGELLAGLTHDEREHLTVLLSRIVDPGSDRRR